MPKDKSREHCTARPVGKHATAACANIEKTKPGSNVPIPSEIEVENAKEWVESNEK